MNDEGSQSKYTRGCGCAYFSQLFSEKIRSEEVGLEIRDEG